MARSKPLPGTPPSHRRHITADRPDLPRLHRSLLTTTHLTPLMPEQYIDGASLGESDFVPNVDVDGKDESATGSETSVNYGSMRNGGGF